MKSSIRLFSFLIIIATILACNFNTTLLTPRTPVTAVPIPSAAATEMTATPSAGEGAPAEQATENVEDEDTDNVLDPCSLITAAEAEAILGEPVSPAKVLNGSCVFTNAKDGIYSLNVATAQKTDTYYILQSQATLLGLSGINIDSATLDKFKAMALSTDFKGFFTELVLTAKGSTIMNARLYKGGGNDLTYWAWIKAAPRQQGAYVAVRGDTLVNINIVTSETQKEADTLKAINDLSGSIFRKLPKEFDSGQPTPSTSFLMQQTSPTEELVSSSTPMPANTSSTAPTVVSDGKAAPTLIAPPDGTVSDNFPRTLTLTWSPVPGAASYLVEIMACSNSNPNECFSHPMIEQTTRETTTTSYTFNFIGAQPGKWRVTPLDANRKLGTPSVWWTFKYTK